MHSEHDGRPVEILMIEDNPGDVRLTREALKEGKIHTRLSVVCDGDAITVRLNGSLVNAATRSSLTSGKILFQSEGAAIDFRTIEVRPLTK